MSANKHLSKKMEHLLMHRKEYMKLSRNKASQYLEQHNFSESEKSALRKYRRNVQNKLCSKKYRNGFKEKIDELEKKIATLCQENRLLKNQHLKTHLHWKKKMLQNFSGE